MLIGSSYIGKHLKRIFTICFKHFFFGKFKKSRVFDFIQKMLKMRFKVKFDSIFLKCNKNNLVLWFFIFFYLKMDRLTKIVSLLYFILFKKLILFFYFFIFKIPRPKAIYIEGSKIYTRDVCQINLFYTIIVPVNLLKIWVNLENSVATQGKNTSSRQRAVSMGIESWREGFKIIDKN